MRNTIKNILSIILLLVVVISCESEEQKVELQKVDWNARHSGEVDFKNLRTGKTYLPIYSHIYHIFEKRSFNLTITISIRNISITDTIHVLKADYFDTEGNKIRQYIKEPVFVKPMETVEIVIAEDDKEGGSGGNFIFDWALENPKNPPLFEAVMISTYSQQGLSFTTRGVQIFE